MQLLQGVQQLCLHIISIKLRVFLQHGERVLIVRGNVDDVAFSGDERFQAVRLNPYRALHHQEQIVARVGIIPLDAQSLLG